MSLFFPLYLLHFKQYPLCSCRCCLSLCLLMWYLLISHPPLTPPQPAPPNQQQRNNTIKCLQQSIHSIEHMSSQRLLQEIEYNHSTPHIFPLSLPCFKKRKERKRFTLKQMKRIKIIALDMQSISENTRIATNIAVNLHVLATVHVLL